MPEASRRMVLLPIAAATVPSAREDRSLYPLGQFTRMGVNSPLVGVTIPSTESGGAGAEGGTMAMLEIFVGVTPSSSPSRIRR